MTKLDDILDWYTRPVNRVEFLDTRKKAVKELIDGIIFESDEPSGPKNLRSEADILEGLAEL